MNLRGRTSASVGNGTFPGVVIDVSTASVPGSTSVCVSSGGIWVVSALADSASACVSAPRISRK